MKQKENNGIHFTLADLAVAEKGRETCSFEEVAKSLSMGSPQYDVYGQHFENIENQGALNLVAFSPIEKPLLNLGKHAFLMGLRIAYEEHRPFVLSPDMIWLLISQGFAHHVNFNTEKLRHLFVNFQAKKALEVRISGLIFYPDKWAAVPQMLIDKMRPNLPEGIIDVLTADFSTTSINEKIASQISILYGFKSYFDYDVVSDPICGIPAITLEGNPEDWQKIIDKVQALRPYLLDDWIDALLPILSEIVESSKGQINLDFWRNMYKIPEYGFCGGKGKIDGWIIKFFPYFEDGTATDLLSIPSNSDIHKLPDEILATPFNLSIIENEGDLPLIKIMEFVAGFVGLSQNEETKALRPEIGWFVGEPKPNPRLDASLSHKDARLYLHQLEEIPAELYSIKRLHILSLSFIDKVKIPKKLLKIRFRYLYINGNISEEEKRKVMNWFYGKFLCFNGERVNYEEESLFMRMFGFVIYLIRRNFWWL